jgi:hypothetical protein
MSLLATKPTNNNFTARASIAECWRKQWLRFQCKTVLQLLMQYRAMI